MNIEGTQLTALQTAISNILDAPIVSRFVLVAETIDADGITSLQSLKSPGLPIWVASGMLRWEADTMAGQPGWTAPDDEDDEP
jgi:hypothetical protein